MSGGGDFWARRRAGVAAEAEAEKAAVQSQALAEEHAAYDDMSDAEVLAALDLPDPDTLGQGDDFTVFMAKAVPDAIRRRALRTLWRSNPVLANVDMLVDYGEDFTDAATVVENLQTTYQVGKGMLKHVEEMARQAEEKAAAASKQDDDPDDQAQDVAQSEIAAEEPEPTPDPVPLDTYADAEIPVDLDDTYTTHAPRRMKFRIEETA